MKYAEETDRPKIIALFERAIKDYMCEAIFSVHCLFCLQTFNVRFHDILPFCIGVHVGQNSFLQAITISLGQCSSQKWTN